MSRNYGIPPRLDVEMLCENGAIKATTPKPRKSDRALSIAVFIAVLAVVFAFVANGYLGN